MSDNTVFYLSYGDLEHAEHPCWAFPPTMRFEDMASVPKFWHRKGENARWDDRNRDFEKALILWKGYLYLDSKSRKMEEQHDHIRML